MNNFTKAHFTLQVTLKWLVTYLFNSRRPKPQPTHIFFCTVDHYEPGTGGVSLETENDRVTRLLDRFPRLADRHYDCTGTIPKRTWFFPPHYHRNDNLRRLVSLCERGYGEIELHLHHGKKKPDTSENLRDTIARCVEEYSLFGIFGSQDGKKRYAFIHGDWALANSRNNKYCGVHNELRVLKETGCYADFTFPSLNEANPTQINSIYYVKCDAPAPQSHRKGDIVRHSSYRRDDLMIIQGSLHPYFIQNRLTGLRILGDAINGQPPVTPRRIDLWVKTAIHVEGRRDCIFIKTHTHGATDAQAVLGNEMDAIYTYLETEYNDGHRYRLYYVTAREMYNIIKSIESGGMIGSPENYRNYHISPPDYDSSATVSEASEKLKNLVWSTYE